MLSEIIWKVSFSDGKFSKQFKKTSLDKAKTVENSKLFAEEILEAPEKNSYPPKF
jgi:hypothetical protein